MIPNIPTSKLSYSLLGNYFSFNSEIEILVIFGHELNTLEEIPTGNKMSISRDTLGNISNCKSLNPPFT